MTDTRAKISLTGVFLLSLAVQLIGISAVHSTMWPEDYQSVLLKLLHIYSVPLGVATGGILATSKSKDGFVDGSLVWISLGLVLLWNGIFVTRTLAFCFSAHDSAKDMMGFYQEISTGSSFLIAGVLAFFFGKTGSRKMGVPQPSRGK
jgi:hypothetical protein